MGTQTTETPGTTDPAGAIGRVAYALDEAIATITMDDGRVNVISEAMLAELHVALDRAQTDRAVAVLAGRPGVFSAGFDLAVLADGGPAAVSLVLGGFELSRRLLSFPLPVVVVCTGHAIAMGAFLLVSGDCRIGVDGPYRYVANEVAIGLTIPHTAVEILRQRLTPSALSRAVGLSEIFSPANGVNAGFVDEVVPAADLAAVARERAVSFATLDLDAHAASKLRARRPALAAIDAALDLDRTGF